MEVAEGRREGRHSHSLLAHSVKLSMAVALPIFVWLWAGTGERAVAADGGEEE